MNKNCGNCAYYDMIDGMMGECRRLPPQSAEPIGRKFPVVKTDDWCGEYKYKGNTDEVKLMESWEN